MPKPPWSLETGIDGVVSHWLAKGAVRSCLRADRTLEAKAGHSVPFTRFSGETGDGDAGGRELVPQLTAALARRGIHALYDHQQHAIAHARGGRHVVVATPTASGKSLCFHLPVLDAIARDPSATAMFLYPTKALSRDQEQSLRGLVEEAGLGVGATVYDGDTPGDARRAAREHARVVMTNPDMLHAGILPQHASWARTFQNLRYVVVDELHTYRGVFGSHVAHVLGRLRRIARFHGSDPTFVCATATIGNPREHSARLIGVEPDDVELVDQSSAPRGQRRVFLYNPPVVNAELGIRASYIKSAVRLATDLIRARVRTIVFGQSRNNVEIMLKYLRDRFGDAPSLREAIVAYRGGYLPDERRRVERGLRSGEVLCVVATSALELGIDIGDLDAVVCAGYPGSLAETWQRFGRAGRRGDASIAVLVTCSSPLDQYLAAYPEHLLDGSIEHARIDPDNTEILIQHLKCAAFELPFVRGERYRTMSADDTEGALGFLQEHGVLHASGGRFHWSADAFPANHVSLRSIGWDNFVIIDLDTDLTLAELDWHSTPTMLHEQAIYQHDGAQYQVERLDYDNHKAYVRRVEPDYFTTALTQVKVRVLEDEAEAPLATGPAVVGWGDVCITEKVVGYKKVKFHTHENAGYGDVRLPDMEMHTTSFWLTVPAASCEAVGRVEAVEGLRGIANALELVATLALMCDPHDIGRTISDDSFGESNAVPDVGDSEAGVFEQFSATAYLYDNVPGGVGLAERIYERASELLARTGMLVMSCDCALGCPSCVGATAIASAEEPASVSFDRKRATIRLLRHLRILPDAASALDVA